MHAKNPDREIRRKIQEIGEKHYIETFEKNPPSGGFRGDFYFSLFCRAFCSSFYQKKSCFPASGLGDGQTNAQRCWEWYTTNMTNRTFLTYHFYGDYISAVVFLFALFFVRENYIFVFLQFYIYRNDTRTEIHREESLL